MNVYNQINNNQINFSSQNNIKISLFQPKNNYNMNISINFIYNKNDLFRNKIF